MKRAQVDPDSTDRVTLGSLALPLRVPQLPDCPRKAACLSHAIKRTCISSFPCHYSKIPDRSNLSGFAFGSQHQGAVYHDGEGHGGRNRRWFSFHPYAGTGESWIKCPAYFLLCILSGTPAHGRVLPTFKVEFPSVESVWKFLPRHSWGGVLLPKRCSRFCKVHDQLLWQCL